MDRLALLATLHARPGKESEVEEFLKSAQPLVEQETRHEEMVRIQDRIVHLRDL